MSNIHEDHKTEWSSSCVSPEIIERNVWSLDDPEEVDKLLNRNAKRRWKHSDQMVPCWAVSGVDPKTGERAFKGVQVKPDNPIIDEKTKKPRKYFGAYKSASSPLFLEMEDHQYWPKLITDLTSPIVITEGAKKAGAVLSQGIACVSLPGVTTGGKLARLKPELELFARYGRSLYLAFDRDIIAKRQVRAALHNLGRMLADKGAMVYVVEWDDRHKGIDDFIAATGEQIRDRLFGALTLEEWRDRAESQYDDEPDEPCLLARRYKQVASKLAGRVRWNHLRGGVELDGQPAELDNLRMFLALKYNIQIPAEDCSQIIQHLSKQQAFSPVVEYLHAVANEYPPDSELLDSVAPAYLGTESQLHSTYIRKTLISAVARAITPGCKVDTVCILAGLQGVGKSTFWKVLSRDWFDDSIGNSGDKDERLKLHKAWFVEWAELETVFKRKDISATKAFITTQVDQVRPPYGRTVQDFPRPSIIVGTTNFDEFLADPTGNRRFWVVPIQAPAIPLDTLAENCDRIWAAAFHAFKRGEAWTLPPELRQQAQLDNMDYAMSDPWEDAVFDYLDSHQRVTTTEILTNAIGLDLDKQTKGTQMRVANLCKSNGWRSSREVVHGKRTRIWEKPFSSNKVVQVVPEVSKTQIAEGGQPSGQPQGQPQGQPSQNDESYESQNERDNLDNLDNLFPKSTGTLPGPQCLPKESLTNINRSIQQGDVVIPTGDTVWYRKGSARLPKGSLPYGLGKEASVNLSLMEVEGMDALQAPSMVLSVSEDGYKLRIRNQKTGRTSTVSTVGTRLMPQPVEALS
ncbi:MAG: VapE domain-containing protein [Cyanobacteria bacterium P01_H01_bin.58]